MQQPGIVTRTFLLLVGSLTILTSFVPGSPAQAASRVITSGAPPGIFTPDQIIARAKTWIDSNVQYDRYPPYQNGYRRDCSGFVTWAWGLSATSSKGKTTDNPGGGLNTEGIVLVSDPIQKDELIKGDVLLNLDRTDEFDHVVIFVSWANPQHTKYVADEEESPSGAQVVPNMDYPYLSQYYVNASDYQPRRLNLLKASNLGYIPTSDVTPTVHWITPNNNDSVTDVIHFAASVKQNGLTISKVFFTLASQGAWQVACNGKANGITYKCDANLPNLGVGYGQLTISVDMVDEAGNVFKALPGERTVTRVPTPGSTPTQQPNFSPFVGTWDAHSRYITINKDGSGIYAGRTFATCGQYPPPCDNPPQGGMNSTIMFTSITGLTIAGTLIKGTGVRGFTMPNTVITVGSNITFTLQADLLGHYTLLKGSDGWLGCYYSNGSTTVPTNDPHYFTNCDSGA